MTEPADASASYTTKQIIGAISSAMRDDNMPAVASLLKMLAVKDPNSAQLILEAIAL